jgi:hypothetical protein
MERQEKNYVEWILYRTQIDCDNKQTMIQSAESWFANKLQTQEMEQPGASMSR